jgi:16S rRNA U1498 N3-methylase RsmE
LAAADGWQRVHLGPRPLRTETAALALAAYLLISVSTLDT